MPNILYAAALAYCRAGCSLIPIAADGTKRPASWLLPKVWNPSDQRWIPTWKPLQKRLPTEAELRHWFARERVGLALIGGQISGGLEILDFDAIDVYGPWRRMVDECCPGLVGRLPVTQTPDNGRHLYYRCRVVEGNLKLAQDLGLDCELKTLIETRGEGGYAIAPPSPSACHLMNQPYVLLRGDPTKIPTITLEERTILLNTARAFNTYMPPEHVVVGPRVPAPRQANGERPGDLFNAHATWPDILEPHGWTRVGQRGEVIFWKRPGKRVRGSSATTNYAGSDLLYMFSSNAHPFEPERAYDKFTAYALLEHHGDFRAAARLLSLKGYRRPRDGELLPPLHDPWLGPRWKMHGIPLAVRRIGGGEGA
jgi:Bifunctional DNA primase/polymerase, N-terminal